MECESEDEVEDRRIQEMKLSNKGLRALAIPSLGARTHPSWNERKRATELAQKKRKKTKKTQPDTTLGCPSSQHLRCAGLLRSPTHQPASHNPSAYWSQL